MSTLWLVTTPIGNLGDLPPRAVDVLAHVGLICCEDTVAPGCCSNTPACVPAVGGVQRPHRGEPYRRRAGVLGDGLRRHRERRRHARDLRSGRTNRAGSDRGRLRRQRSSGAERSDHGAHDSGLATDRFVFEGFIPRKGAERAARLTGIANEHRTIVIYEAPHRILRTLEDLRDACGDDRQVVVARELTKLHEEVGAAPSATSTSAAHAASTWSCSTVRRSTSDPSVMTTFAVPSEASSPTDRRPATQQRRWPRTSVDQNVRSTRSRSV